MKFKKLKKDLASEDFWYDLTMGGYLKPTDFSSDKPTLKAIEDAIALISKLQEMVEENMESQEGDE